jgi:hypothetical protein
MLPCASKYYADIWPCYIDHYKQYESIAPRGCYEILLAFFASKNDIEFLSFPQILSTGITCLQLTFKQTSHHQQLPALDHFSPCPLDLVSSSYKKLQLN